MSLREDLHTKDFVITAELNPPKGSSPKALISNAAKIKNKVSAVNITDGSGASMKMCPLAISYLVQAEAGVEAIWQMTCRDRNRLALQSDLLGGWALGLKNVLVLGGDPVDKGDAPEAKPVYDLNTENLIKAITELKSGKDFDGNDVNIEEAGFNFCVAAAAHPAVPDLKKQAETMRRRLELGAEFFQTQICFEKDQLSKFAESIGSELASKTLVGITPLKTLRQGLFINKNIWGVDVPENVLNAMDKALGTDDPKSDSAKLNQATKGIELSKPIVEHARSLGFKGIHLMAIGQENNLDTIIDGII